jgi:hypothetical protein
LQPFSNIRLFANKKSKMLPVFYKVFIDAFCLLQDTCFLFHLFDVVVIRNSATEGF